MTPIDLSNFWVVTGISNVARFKSRYHLYKQFADHMKASGVNFLTVEVAYGHRPHEITQAGNPNHLQLRTYHELWHKENMINAAVKRLPDDWKYLAVVDADILFTRQDWAQETVQQLQHFDVIQMFSMALDMGPHPKLDIVGSNYGFAYCHHASLTDQKIPPLLNSDGRLNSKRMSRNGYGICDKKVYWHPGFAWAWRRKAWENIGGLFEDGVLGAGDHHMCLSFLGRASEGIPHNVSPGYRKAVMAWERLALQYVRKNIGFLPGIITHNWHGPKTSRRYWDRWKILVNNQFDPSNDLKRDSQGLWQLVDHGDDRYINLRDQIRAYFHQRSEDSDQLDPV